MSKANGSEALVAEQLSKDRAVIELCRRSLVNHFVVRGLCFKKCVHSYYSLSVICRHVKLFPYDARTIPIRRSSTTTRFL